MVRNRGIDELRSAATRRKTRELAEVEAPRSQPCEAFGETWGNAQRLSRRERVREALQTLPSEQLEVVRLAYFCGRTHVEIKPREVGPREAEGALRRAPRL